MAAVAKRAVDLGGVWQGLVVTVSQPCRRVTPPATAAEGAGDPADSIINRRGRVREIENGLLNPGLRRQPRRVNNAARPPRAMNDKASGPRHPAIGRDGDMD
jgi:hypothetical protein